MTTKTEAAKRHYRQGEIGKAIKIFSKFHGFGKAEQRCLQIASECYYGSSSFYESIGIDVEKVERELCQMDRLRKIKTQKALKERLAC